MDGIIAVDGCAELAAMPAGLPAASPLSLSDFLPLPFPNSDIGLSSFSPAAESSLV